MSRTEIVISCVTGQQAQKVQIRAKDEPDHSLIGIGIGRRFVREDVVEYKTILGAYRSRTVWSRPQMLVEHGKHYGEASEQLDYHTTVTFIPIVSPRLFAFTSQRACGQVSRNIRVYVTDPCRFDAIINKLVMHIDDPHLATTTLKQWLAEGGNPFLLDEYGRNLLDVSMVLEDNVLSKLNVSQMALTYTHGDVACLLIQMRVGLDPCLRK